MASIEKLAYARRYRAGDHVHARAGRRSEAQALGQQSGADCAVLHAIARPPAPAPAAQAREHNVGWPGWIELFGKVTDGVMVDMILWGCKSCIALDCQGWQAGL
jgi:hypothetical protein